MQNSSSFCRTREALETKRAEETSLDNVKSIAMKAAQAWGIEAAAAEQREDRQRKRLAATQTSDQTASENPDRGYAESE